MFYILDIPYLFYQVHMTPDLLVLNTYDRLFQRLVSTHKEIPLGIYRTSYMDNQVSVTGFVRAHCGE